MYVFLSSSKELIPITTDNVSLTKQSGNHFERMNQARSSAIIKSLNATKSNANRPFNSTVEYASFNIKPSQYKQTGIFLPINNEIADNNGSHHKDMQTTKINCKALKDELEILIQSLRNIQKSNLGSNKITLPNDDADFRHLTHKSFIEKLFIIDKFLKSVNNLFNGGNGLFDIGEFKSLDSIKQIQFSVKQDVATLNQLIAKYISSSREIMEITMTNMSEHDSTAFDLHLCQISKSFNDLNIILNNVL
jgi:hypothetical protein